jgi:hypothetical protein
MRSIGLVASGLAVAVGCSSVVQGDSPRHESSAASGCFGNPRKPPVCNSMKCTPDGWTAWPLTAGSSCTINGSPGKCDGGEVMAGVIEPLRIGKCVPTITGTILPRFYVLDVIYAPPGTSGSATRSSVTYASGSTSGTETKTTKAFKSELNVQAEATLQGFATISAGAGYSLEVTSENGVTLKKTTTFTIGDQGPNTDGIDHDSDLLVLWLNPAVDMIVNGNDVKWTLSTNGTAMDIQWVSVGQLKNPATIPPGVAARFAQYGITTDDLATMLAQDPFAYGPTAIDLARFAQTPTTLPYEPPLTKNDTPPTFPFGITNETIQSHMTKYESSYSVGFSIKVATPTNFSTWISANLTDTAKFTWTDSGSTTTTTDSTQSASVTLTGPSFGYAGPTDIAVYVDTQFDTFMFAEMPTTTTPSIAGTIKDASGAGVAGREVTLETSAGMRRTVSGAGGVYRVYGAPTGAAKITVGGVSHAVTIGALGVRHDVVVPD